MTKCPITLKGVERMEIKFIRLVKLHNPRNIFRFSDDELILRIFADACGLRAYGAVVYLQIHSKHLALKTRVAILKLTSLLGTLHNEGLTCEVKEVLHRKRPFSMSCGLTLRFL